MSDDTAPAQAATATLKQLGARVVEDQGKVLLIDLAEAAIGDEDVAILNNFPHLRSLTLADTDITDEGLQHLAELTSLETLDLSTTQVTTAGLASLTKLDKLDMLILGGCKVGGSGLSVLKELPALRMLILSDTDISDAGLAELAELTQLRNLNLDYTDITDSGLPHLTAMPELELLGLVFCKRVTDEGIQHLKSLSNLQVLDVCTTMVTPDGVRKLQTDLPECFIAYSPDPLLEAVEAKSGNVMAALKSIGQVETDDNDQVVRLRVDQAQLTRAGLEYLKQFNRLEDLSLYHHRQLPDAGLTTLRSLKYLKKLGLLGTNVTDEGLRYLSDLSSIRVLNLAYTPVTARTERYQDPGTWPEASEEAAIA